MKKKYIAIIAVIIVLILIFVAYGWKKKKPDMDYSLIFDDIYYQYSNPDVKEIFGSSKEELYKHFISSGMSEGRRGASNFDVTYYKENNPDLREIYGEDLSKYYEHYMLSGYEEGRKGSSEDIVSSNFECELHCELKNSENVKLSLKFDKNKWLDQCYILEMPAYENKVENGTIVSSGRRSSKEVVVSKSSITNKYVVCKKNGEKYEPISNFCYIENPELENKAKEVKTLEPISKKGVQIDGDRLDDVENLEPSYAFFNFFIGNVLQMEQEEENTITYDYQGNTYFFDKTVILGYDYTISRLTNDGISIIASILSRKEDGYDVLFYPGISMDTGATFYAVNTTNADGLRYFEATVSFLSERYNGTSKEHGLISKYTIGNEVNESGTYNYMGEKEIDEYTKEYARTFRIAYNIIKSNSHADVYVPMEPWWGISSNLLTYGGREFLQVLNHQIKEEGDMDWGVAYHAYSYPLSDPKVLNDNKPTIDEKGEILEGLVTTNSFYTTTITMENIDVLTDFMSQKEFLKKDGNVRSIILSEQGYTSNSYSYGKCEAEQAASMLYAYYKTEMNKKIDAFIYFLQIDTMKSSLGNNYYQFGLSYREEEDKIKQKLAYDVFKNMDKKDSIEKYDYLKKVLGIEKYEEVIPNFEPAIFEKLREVEANPSGKENIENAQISAIVNQKYTGKECVPEVVVEYNGKRLINDVDYDVAYLDNIESGEATAVIVGLNEYEGAKEIKFLIE